MKKSIKLTVAFLLLAIGAFAGTPSENPAVSPASNSIVIRGILTKIGVMIYSPKEQATVPLVTISDHDGHTLYKGALSRNARRPVIYNFSELENGDYFIVVTINEQQVKKQVHIYEENGSKTYFVME